MSLINQMLQELDARRSDVTTAGPYGQQVRAVAPRRKVHPAWWIALALAGALAGVLGWVFFNPPAQQPVVTPANAQLPLKLDIDLAAKQPPEQKPRVVENSSAPATPAEVVVDRAEQAVVPASLPGGATTPAEPLAAEKRPAAPKPAAVLTRPAAAVPDLGQVVPPAKPPVTPASGPVPESAPSVVPNKQFKEISPQQRAENEYRKAVAALQQGKSAEAIALLDQVLQIDAHHAPARQAMIGALVESKQLDEAVGRARDGLSLDPNQPGLAMILARLQLEKREVRAAIDTLERTLPYAGDRAEYRAFLAALLQRDERHKQAAEQYLLALQRAPQNGVWWMGLGISLEADQRLPEAQESFRRAIASNSLTPELRAFVENKLGLLRR